MEEEGGMKRKKKSEEGEVDYKSKSGTAWSHSYLNQKPWHPLSYPNQRRKWIAEQTHANRLRRAEEVAREYAHEQEFFRQSSLLSNHQDKEKLETMRAVSFMYVRPPGYDPESARAAELAQQEPKPKPAPKDVFGRSLPTEDNFEVLKNAPRLETGVAGRVKPFGVEVRNVKCLRCGSYGHQSGDRECPLKDAIMPNEQTRLKRDDPLTAILVHTDPSEPLKWELKQKPGISPPRGGFKPDDPNQQIVAEEIFDEYGGFLSGGDIPELLSNFSSKPKKKSRKKSRHKKHQSSPNSKEFKDDEVSSASTEGERRGSHKRKHEKKNKKRKKKRNYSGSGSSSSDDSESDRYSRKSKDGHDSMSKERRRGRRRRRKRLPSYSSEDWEGDRWMAQQSSPRKDSKNEDTKRQERISSDCFERHGSKGKESGPSRKHARRRDTHTHELSYR